MSFSIRRLSMEDVAAYRAIRHAALVAHPEAFGNSPEEFGRRSDDELARLLGALAIYAAVLPDGSLAGLAAFERDEGQKSSHRGWLLQVYVDPAQRGTGMGEALVNRVIEHARHHVRQIHLGVWTGNAPALALYQRCGFEFYGTDPRYLYVNGRYVDEHLMVRFLDEAPGKSSK